MAKVVAAGRKHGIPVGYPAGSPAEINKRIARGKRFFQADNELSPCGAARASCFRSSSAATAT